MNKYLTQIVAIICLVSIFQFCLGQGDCISGSPYTPPVIQTGVTYESGTLVLPQSNDFHQNTFDWTQAAVPVFKQDFGNFSLTETLRSPFWRSNPFYGYIAKEQYSDFLPEGGWELVKQDMGYLYNSTTSQWNGTGISNTSSFDNLSMAYFILYNKYSAKLRVMAAPSGRSLAQRNFDLKCCKHSACGYDFKVTEC